ncbi:hypothetical protein JAAARDRAFT_204515 [Jaapia argillacea MUCL 33604]|uniref:Aminoglycoside phosphotransferase domain-containing protein n=1 Tax=Jaapia argillacea MUCL 33604 TaxID=933084 RepID=A0A067Q3F6_9AGAM|nr:hypothetical protein JAAARDRAFT_204515 [Jaapia argillacea MUCL 33604]
MAAFETPPFGESVLFRDSSFFKQGYANACRLPTPAQVRAEGKLQAHPTSTRANLVRFSSLDVIIKYGRGVTFAEGQCLHSLRRVFGSRVPVPDIYGWCKDDREVFLYMELVQGRTLEECWESLSVQERDQVCNHLRLIVDAVRTLKQDPADSFVEVSLVDRSPGHIHHQPLLDIIFTITTPSQVGPFPSIASFHDFLVSPISSIPSRSSPHPFRSELPDDGSITFTHNDLHPSNILVSKDAEGSFHVAAIVDWHQSGWYPDYWEFCKARWTGKNIWDPRTVDEWDTEYLTRILQPFEQYHYWDYFVLCLGV